MTDRDSAEKIASIEFHKNLDVVDDLICMNRFDDASVKLLVSVEKAARQSVKLDSDHLSSLTEIIDMIFEKWPSKFSDEELFGSDFGKGRSSKYQM